MDPAHYDQLGHRLHVYGPGAEHHVALYRSCFLLGAAEAGFFPGVVLAFDLVDPVPLPRTHYCGVLYGRHPAQALHRLPAFRVDTVTGWLAGPSRLASAVHH